MQQGVRAHQESNLIIYSTVKKSTKDNRSRARKHFEEMYHRCFLLSSEPKKVTGKICEAKLKETAETRFFVFVK